MSDTVVNSYSFSLLVRLLIAICYQPNFHFTRRIFFIFENFSFSTHDGCANTFQKQVFSTTSPNRNLNKDKHFHLFRERILI